MSLAGEIFLRLNVAAVVELVGADHIFPNVVPDVSNQPTRYIVYSVIADRPENHLEGRANLEKAIIQISCIAEKYDIADRTRRAVGVAITASQDADFNSLIQDQRDQYVPDLKKHDAQLDVSVAYRA